MEHTGSRPDRAEAPVLGLTGAPGSGKSFVARAFADLGAAVVDADALARAALDTDDVQDRLRAWWGDGIVGPDGTTDRAAVGRRVFDNPDELRRLEGLVHPIVGHERARLHEHYRRDPAVTAIVEDCPLLLESGLDAECDVVVLVEASEAMRQARVAEHRGWSAAELARRDRNQWPLDIKRERADHVIVNDAGHVDVSRQVAVIFDKVRGEVRGKVPGDHRPSGGPTG